MTRTLDLRPSFPQALSGDSYGRINMMERASEERIRREERASAEGIRTEERASSGRDRGRASPSHYAMNGLTFTSFHFSFIGHNSPLQLAASTKSVQLPFCMQRRGDGGRDVLKNNYNDLE